MGPHLRFCRQWPYHDREFFHVAVVTSSFQMLAPSRTVIIPSVEEMSSPTFPPPWRVAQKDTPQAGQAGSCRGLTDQSLCTNMNMYPQTCRISVEPKKYLCQTYLPSHRYWESTARATALVGNRYTSIQIQGILASIATPQIKCRYEKGAAGGKTKRLDLGGDVAARRRESRHAPEPEGMSGRTTDLGAADETESGGG